MTPIASVVIPAHNEAASMHRCLRQLLAGAARDEIDVIVVANACADDTAAIARRAGVRVIETPVPGKTNALRLGDEACLVFPRVYADADVDLAYPSLRLLVDSLAVSGAMAAAPVPTMALAGTSRV